LCQRGAIVSVRQCINRVVKEGNIDLGTLLVAAQHLFTRDDPNVPRSIEKAGNLLTHRYATRPGDDVVIWSLLCSRILLTDVKMLWKSKIDTKITTAYLFNNAPRVEDVDGFGWAPQTPGSTFKGGVTGEDSLNHLPMDGYGSEQGLITRCGLQATWMAYEVFECCEHEQGGNPKVHLEKVFDRETNMETTRLFVLPTTEGKQELLQLSLMKDDLRYQRVCLMIPKFENSRWYGNKPYHTTLGKRSIDAINFNNWLPSSMSLVLVCFSNEHPGSLVEGVWERWSWGRIYQTMKPQIIPLVFENMKPRDILLA
jgi:hypothetical protein